MKIIDSHQSLQEPEETQSHCLHVHQHHCFLLGNKQIWGGGRSASLDMQPKLWGQ